ncbi:hypothetical protein [Candidatus Trichorickettsia mobilis]|uniref:hypothetical protein n=1 Tax=Candidatus Trichorickettsia mobilis TaxID=1346319 RepID=UPI0029300389|nr:hypothetical protein [Candidatus Trichorickettsia mobilis]
MTSAHAESRFIELGNPEAKDCWVYLCGLAESFYSSDEQKYRQILHDIGSKLNIRFIALMPRYRCAKFDNKICWAHQDFKQATETYQSILTDLQGMHVTGWIGFSNGGYFLHEISQQKFLTAPVITIGAAGHIDSTDQVYIMIGKYDKYAYERAKNLRYKIIEYEGGHTIDSDALGKTLQLICTPPNG